MSEWVSSLTRLRKMFEDELEETQNHELAAMSGDHLHSRFMSSSGRISIF
jgi:hypothetical protein